MIKSKFLRKIAGLPAEEVEHDKKAFVERFKKNVGSQKQKNYPVPEEEKNIPPDDNSMEVKYNTKKNKHNQ
jgi:hypothetical protein